MTFFTFFLFVCLFVLSAPVHAGSLKFDQGVVTVKPGDTFTLQAIVDAASDQITSTDMWILYDPAILEAQSASPAAFFPAVTNNITSGKVYVAGLITDPGSYKTGSGAVANISFKALKNGSATISYDCRTDVSNSSKIIKNAVDTTNVINCAQNGTSIVTVGTGAGTTGVPTQPPLVTSAYQNQVQPTALPQSGIADVMPRLMTVGGFLVAAGIIMRLLLLL
jgi:hypothetical protein